jgi:hypothetical protein
MADLDQSGNAWHKARTWLGPTLGWADTQVKPTRLITIAGTYQVFTGDSVIFVNIGGLVTLVLPDVRLWIQEPASQPATGFERAIWVKDLGGNAASFPITIAPFGTQTIDLLSTPFQVVVNRQLIRLYPLNDQTGWWVG